jgi:hypothetical protein
LFWGGCPFVLSCFSGVEVILKMQCLHSKMAAKRQRCSAQKNKNFFLMYF